MRRGYLYHCSSLLSSLPPFPGDLMSVMEDDEDLDELESVAEKSGKRCRGDVFFKPLKLLEISIFFLPSFLPLSRPYSEQTATIDGQATPN